MYARAHRVVFAATNGWPPVDRPFVTHDCGRRNCIEVTHLVAGDAASNAQDAIRHGGRPGHPRHPNAKLRPATVRRIRRLRARGRSTPAIARALGIPRETVWDIVRGHTWAWLEP
jgi:hypothetical protein